MQIAELRMQVVSIRIDAKQGAAGALDQGVDPVAVHVVAQPTAQHPASTARGLTGDFGKRWELG